MNPNNQAGAAQLLSTDGQAVTLQSVHIEGRLDGLLLGMKTRQLYRNTGQTNLETVYTFPLPWGATLLGLHAEIAGHRLQGTVLEKKQATQQYEKAIDEGDTPIMVERSARGLYTANLGNLKPGEDAVIEIEYAQLLRFEQGQIRITIPTTVAPRYGDAHASGGLAAHESVEANPLVEYPLSVRLTLTGEVARAAVHSPSHAVSLASEASVLTVTLKQGAFLDRDFVLLLQGLQGKSFATVVPEGDEFAVLASFYPGLADKANEPMLLKVLVDCSGSMAGDSIVAARAALHEVLKELSEKDFISYSRFGTEVQHDLPALWACDPVTIRAVATLIAKTQADLGGTEMNSALLSTFQHGADRDGQPYRKGAEYLPRSTDVLLITDGDIWNVEEVIRTAQDSGHRVFAIGVGSAPAQSLLREVAENTGGACELVSPNQDVGEVIVRMFRRLRASRCNALSLNWGQEACWQSPLPASLFGGDTLHLYARFKNSPQQAPSLSWSSGGGRSQTAASTLEALEGDTLARLCGAAQFDSFKMGEADQQRLALALRYQLVTDLTNLILVHVRKQEDKAIGLPVLNQIAHMQAAGWGGSGSVQRKRVGTAQADCFAITDFFAMAPPAPASSNAAPTAVLRKDCQATFEIPQFLRKPANSDGSMFAMSPGELLEALNEFWLVAKDFDGILELLMHRGIGNDITELLALIAAQVGGLQTAWALLLEWLIVQLGDQCVVHRHAQRVIRAQLSGVDESVRLLATARFAAALPAVSSTAWGEVLMTPIDQSATVIGSSQG